MQTFKETCIQLGIDLSHSFESPFLRGACIHCGMTQNLHVDTQIKTEEATMPSVSPVQTKAPLFKITTSVDGKEFLSSTWQDLPNAVETFKAVSSATSLDVTVVMQMCGVEVDLLATAGRFQLK